MRSQPALSGARKAAILLAVLGSEVSAQVVRYLSDREIEQVTAELLAVGDLNRVSPAIQQQVLAEFYQQYQAQSAGKSAAHSGAEPHPDPALASPFAFLTFLTPPTLAEKLQELPPQMGALVLAHLPGALAARLLALGPSEWRDEVALRVGQLRPVAPEVVNQVARNLAQQWRLTPTRGSVKEVDGMERLTGILQRMDPPLVEAVMAYISEVDAALGAEVQQRLDIHANH